MLENLWNDPGMPRPFTRAQALQNAAFLKALRRTGNVREAARALGIHRTTMTKRRAKHPAFAADWDAALAVAHAALHRRELAAAPGEPRLVRTAAGRFQLRRATPARLTRDGEQAFLAALSATANIRLSAAAAGFSHSAFYYRAKCHPGFAREMRLALQLGYDRIELALLAGMSPASSADDAWRHNEPPPIPPMTADQALQLLHLHNKETRLWAEAPYLRTRPGETSHQWQQREAARYRAQLAREAEDRIIAAHLNREPTRDAPSPHEPPAPMLPDLAHVRTKPNARSTAARETASARSTPTITGADSAGDAPVVHPHGFAPPPGDRDRNRPRPEPRAVSLLD